MKSLNRVEDDGWERNKQFACKQFPSISSGLFSFHDFSHLLPSSLCRFSLAGKTLLLSHFRVTFPQQVSKTQTEMEKVAL
jgi:hypothetical protein